MKNYDEFCNTKGRRVEASGIADPPPVSAKGFAFQRDIVRVLLQRGRSALFADTGLGKTFMQLEWSRIVQSHTSGRGLILAPLAVSSQTAREGEKFGVRVTRAESASDVDGPGIYATNYEKLHRFDPSIFDFVVLDESSLLKDYTSKTRTALNEAFSATKYKLCCTATPAPNDFTELGNHAQFLGVCTREEMLAEYFVHDGGSTQDWRIKGHAEVSFWQWVASWALVVRRPSDIGYDDGDFELPRLNMHEHVVPAGPDVARNAGLLFIDKAATLSEQRAIRRASIDTRVAMAASIVAEKPTEPWIVWCELNDEGDAIEAAIPGAVQIAGSDSAEQKESRMVDFSEGRSRVIVTKPGICGHGMNWQHCANMVFVGVSHSFEQFYQSIRRSWRFGQKRPVNVHVVSTDADGAVLRNLKRKEADARVMSERSAAHVVEFTRDAVRSTLVRRSPYQAHTAMTVPSWLTEAS